MGTTTMRSQLTLGLLALCALATDVAAAPPDLLPLERGAYALETTPCAQRSRAEIMTFWGDRLNQSGAECRISEVKNQGQTYTYRSRCKIEGERKPLVETITLRIPDPKHFVIMQVVDGKASQTAYKWCAYRAFD